MSIENCIFLGVMDQQTQTKSEAITSFDCVKLTEAICFGKCIIVKHVSETLGPQLEPIGVARRAPCWVLYFWSGVSRWKWKSAIWLRQQYYNLLDGLHWRRRGG